jgi:alpha-galactosidase
VPVKLKGLDARKNYLVEEINLYPGQRPLIAPNSVFSGDFLMNVGINPKLSQSHSSVVLRLKQVAAR